MVKRVAAQLCRKSSRMLEAGWRTWATNVDLAKRKASSFGLGTAIFDRILVRSKRRRAGTLFTRWRVNAARASAFAHTEVLARTVVIMGRREQYMKWIFRTTLNRCRKSLLSSGFRCWRRRVRKQKHHALETRRKHMAGTEINRHRLHAPALIVKWARRVQLRGALARWGRAVGMRAVRMYVFTPPRRRRDPLAERLAAGLDHEFLHDWRAVWQPATSPSTAVLMSPREARPSAVERISESPYYDASPSVRSPRKGTADPYYESYEGGGNFGYPEQRERMTPPSARSPRSGAGPTSSHNVPNPLAR